MLLLLLACNRLPLTEGAYLLLLESQQNTCGLQDRDFGVGETSDIFMNWTSSTILHMESGGVAIDYLYEGDYRFSGTAETLTDVDSRCDLIIEYDDEGTLLDPESFRLFEIATYSVEGPCSNVDISAFPCQADFEMIGFLDD